MCLKIGHYCKQLEVEQQNFEQPRRRRRPVGNAQPAPQPVVPPKVTREWRTKKPVDVKEKPTEDLGANKSNVGVYDHQIPEQRQLPLAICEKKLRVSNKEIHNMDQQP